MKLRREEGVVCPSSKELSVLLPGMRQIFIFVDIVRKSNMQITTQPTMNAASQEGQGFSMYDVANTRGDKEAFRAHSRPDRCTVLRY